MKGKIHSFESLAAVDGAGLRFAVFMAGCPLRCVYCHNPDTWEGVGKEMTPEDLVNKIRRYRPYFGTLGGATFSGGEPLLQSEFLLECASLLKKEGITYVLDTSGAVFLTESVKALLSGAQEILLDLKFWDDESYRAYTGAGIQNTLNTLSFLEEKKIPTVVRTVVVPGINDTPEILKRYRAHLAGKTCIREHELLPFHTMGFFKYESLDIQNPLKGVSALPPERITELKHLLNET